MTSTASADCSWYLIYTKPKQEKMAQTHLQRQGYQVYLPFIQLSRRRQGRYQVIKEPLFPRYLFIQLNAGIDDWSPIRSTRGVTSLVSFGKIPAKVPEKLLVFLRQREDAQHVAPSIEPNFQSGDNVRVLEGVMAGYEGIYESKNGADRVTILLNLVGKSMKIELSIHSLGPVEKR